MHALARFFTSVQGRILLIRSCLSLVTERGEGEDGVQANAFGRQKGRDRARESVHSFEKQSEVSRRLNFPSFFLLLPSSYILRTDGRPCISPPLFSQKKNSPPPPLLFSLLSDPPPPFGRGRRRRAVCSVCAAAKETHGGAPAIMQPRAATTTTYTYYKQQGRESGKE